MQESHQQIKSPIFAQFLQLNESKSLTSKTSSTAIQVSSLCEVGSDSVRFAGICFI